LSLFYLKGKPALSDRKKPSENKRPVKQGRKDAAVGDTKKIKSRRKNKGNGIEI